VEKNIAAECFRAVAELLNESESGDSALSGKAKWLPPGKV
jgi:hypothetical protein